MDNRSLRRWATNVGLLLAVALPVFVVLLDLTRGFRESGESHSIGDRLGDLPLFYVGFFFPYVLGGLCYLVTLAVIAKKWHSSKRALAVGLIPVMAVGWLVFPLRSSLIEPSIALCLVISAVIFALLVRPPDTSQAA